MKLSVSIGLLGLFLASCSGGSDLDLAAGDDAEGTESTSHSLKSGPCDGKGLELSGTVVDESGAGVADVLVKVRGIGRAQFTPTSD